MTLLFHGSDYSLGAKDNIFFCLKRVVKRYHVLSHGHDNALNTPEVERQTTVFFRRQKIIPSADAFKK